MTINLLKLTDGQFKNAKIKVQNVKTCPERSRRIVEPARSILLRAGSAAVSSAATICAYAKLEYVRNYFAEHNIPCLEY